MSGRGTLQQAYHESLRRHGYEPDAAQERAVARLDDLRRRLEAAHERAGGWLARLRRAARREQPAERGLYLWGGVGRGKTFLMDLFHAHLQVPGQRHHFHRFMKDVHGRIGQLRDREDPLPQVAAEIAAEARVLCLDELYVGDIADAMILAGLFAGLDARGVEGQYGKLLSDFREIGAEWIILTPHYVRPDWMKLARQREIDDDPRPYVAGLREFAPRHSVALADASLRWGRLWRQGLPYTTLLLNAVNHPDERGMKLFADSLMALFPMR